MKRLFGLLIAFATSTAACTSDGTAASSQSASAKISASSPEGPASGLGTNGKIAFYRDGQGILTIDPDGTHETQIGGDIVLPSDEAWAPDSSKLLVLRFLEEGARPATVDPDGSDFTILDHYPSLKQHLGCSFWSPDASRFLCMTIEDSKPDNGLYTLRSSDGGGLKQILTTGQGCLRGQPCIEVIPRGYSADGSRILFNEQERSTHLGHLFVVNPDGTDLLQLSPPRLLTPDADRGGVPADWSPDGAQVAFGARSKPSAGQDGESAIFVVNADGTGLHRITPFRVGAVAVRWSPDGRLIAFSSGPQIYVVAPDGTGLRGLPQPSDGDSSFAPVWSPDSAKLLFQSIHPEINGGQEDLWIMNADGTGLFQLTNTPEDENTQNWGSAPVG